MEMTRLLAYLSVVALASFALPNTATAQSSARNDFRSQRPAARTGTRQTANARQAPKPIVTRMPDFAIPLTVDDSYDIAEVRLYASADQGRNWKLYDRRRPNAEAFQFRAPSEGEFWFAVRTADRNGKLISQARLSPELKVTVDTRKPQFDVRVHVAGDGTAVAEWIAQDPHLASHTFRLQYQDDTGNWQPVRVMAPEQGDRRQQWRGQTDWLVRSNANELLVRAEIMDEGKNVSRISKRVSLANLSNGNVVGGNAAARPRFQNDLNSTQHNRFNPNWATNDSRRNVANNDNSRASGRIATRPLQTQPIATRPIGYNKPSDRTSVLRTTQDRKQPPTIGGSFGELFNGARNWFGGVKHSEDTFGATARTRTPRDAEFAKPRDLDAINPPRLNGSAANRTADNSNSKRTLFSPVSQSGQDGLSESSDEQRFRQQAFGQQSVGQERFAQQGFGQVQPPRRTGRPRITSSPNFEIEYDLQGVGSKGARVVELWFTRDEGRTWELYGSDADRRSPMEVRLKNEGMYGFRLAVHGHDTPAPEAPQDNDPADIWVAADWTKPVGRITRAILTGAEQMATSSFDERIGGQLGGQGQANVMSIEWVAEDALLDPHPITLSYSATAEGPWTPIASALDNSGAHDWRIDRQLPERLFLQIEIRDIAGNITSTVYDASDALLGGTPAGKILDIRPIDESASRNINFR